MSLKSTLIKELPPFTNEWQLIKKHQGTTDIISEILQAHNLFADDYDLICDYFYNPDTYAMCRDIWNFEKRELIYNAESGKDQTSSSPTVILHDGELVDCKHYALFAAGVLDAIKKTEAVKWDWFFRFASDKSVNEVTHVFVVVVDRGREIWIDPCLTNFDQRKKYLIIKDETPMALYRRISGVGDIAPAPKTVTYNKDVGFTAFLMMLSKNLFPMTANGPSLIKQVMNDNPGITNGPVKQYFLNNGFDWNQVQAFLKS
jgi:hypothetical protein